jgi:RNA-directed DNA polymerase
MLEVFLWRRVIMWFKTLHRWSWKDIRQRLLGPNGSWLPITVDGVEMINPARTPAITRYRYRGDTIPTPWVIT